MKSLSRCWRGGWAGLLVFAAAFLVRGNTSSDPVGALHLRLRGGSDTIVSLPLQPASIIEGPLNSQNFNQLAIPFQVTSLPAGGAYFLVMSGALEGAVLPINGAINSSTFTVNPGSLDLTTLKTEFGTGTGLGDLVAMVPYWTLDTLFPAGANIYPTTSLMSVQTQILMFDDSVAGINLSASASYFYYAGDGNYAAGWYRVGDMSTTVGSTPLPPNHYFIVRQPLGSADTFLLVTGAVPLASARVALATRAASKAQDNLAALPIPLAVTLGASSLIASGAFRPTTSLLSVKDELLVFDNTVVGLNKSASAVYFYFAGNSGYAAGWYRYGDMSTTVPLVALQPGEGYIIRKAATAAAQDFPWTLLPSYLQ